MAYGLLFFGVALNGGSEKLGGYAGFASALQTGALTRLLLLSFLCLLLFLWFLDDMAWHLRLL